MQDDRIDLLAQIAVWYFEDGMNQDQIAQLIGKSRSMVSRMLNEVRELGLIEVKVQYPLKRNLKLEELLKKQYRLSEAWIVSTKTILTQEMKDRMVGKLSAQCVCDKLHPGIRVGLGWSRTLYRTITSIPSQVVSNSIVVQMSGSVAMDEPKIDGIDLAREFAVRIGAQHYYLPAPLVVSSKETRDNLFKEKTIQIAIEKASDVDLAVVGVGNILSKDSSLSLRGLVDNQTLSEVKNNAVVGDILARQFDDKGRLLDISLNDRVIGVPLEYLKKIPLVIAVSSGIGKAGAILAGMRGGWFNILVSDEETVESLLALDKA